jgi:hypothetical protein
VSLLPPQRLPDPAPYHREQPCFVVNPSVAGALKEMFGWDELPPGIVVSPDLPADEGLPLPWHPWRVSVKSACPGCDEYSSRIATAFGEGLPCPNCGLSYDAVAEIRQVQRSRADEELKSRLAGEIRRRGVAEVKVRRLEHRLAEIKQAMEAADPDWLT